MKIAVASGKGGTGKTTVALNLYHFISIYWDKNVQLVDCDVEEPNDALFFHHLKTEKRQEVFQQIPEINTAVCTFCKKCAEWCEFNAITIIANREYAEVDTSLCHSCGACYLACEFGAIAQKEKPLGVITRYQTGTGNGLTEGRLEIGSAMQTMLIKKLKGDIEQNDSITILDAPPGTSCPVVETVSDADYILLVTEPTPFGLHDLKITVELIRKLKKNYGVVVNKAGLGSEDVYAFLEENNIDLLGKIPFSRKYASQYSAGEILNNISRETENHYRKIIGNLRKATNSI